MSAIHALIVVVVVNVGVVDAVVVSAANIVLVVDDDGDFQEVALVVRWLNFTFLTVIRKHGGAAKMVGYGLFVGLKT